MIIIGDTVSVEDRGDDLRPGDGSVGGVFLFAISIFVMITVLFSAFNDH